MKKESEERTSLVNEIIPCSIEKDQKKYEKICERLQIPMVRAFHRNLASSAISLKHCGIGDRSMEGIELFMRTNTTIKNLNLTDNNLKEQGATLVASIFERNAFIRRLDLSCNNINGDGLSSVLDSLKDSKCVESLNLSDNNIDNKSGTAIGQFIEFNRSIQTLNLSKNNLMISSSLGIRKGLEKNNVLKNLDLSWNQFCRKSVINIFRGLRKNVALKNLDLSWNGCDDEGSNILGGILRINNVLQELDLSYNQISSRGVIGISSGLVSNRSLHVLRLRGNPAIDTDGIQSLLDGLLRNKRCNIQTLDLHGMYASEESELVIAMLKSRDSNFRVILEGFTRSLSNDVTPSWRHEITKLLREYLAWKGIRPVDLFHRWMKTDEKEISMIEFSRGLAMCRLSISKLQIKLLGRWLDADNSGTIDFQEFNRLFR